MSCNKPRLIYQYSNMAPRLSDQNCKYFSFFSLSIPKRDLDAKKTTRNIEVCPESHLRILIYYMASSVSGQDESNPAL